MTATDRPTEPPVECVAVDRDERCLCPGGPASHRPSPPAPAAEDDAVEKAARALYVATAKMWVTHDEAVVPWDDLHPEQRERWRDHARAALDAAGVSVLRAEVERSERDWKQASEDADRWCARAEAAEAEVERLRAERFEAQSTLAWLAPDRTQDGTLSHAVQVVRSTLDEARQQVADLRAVLDDERAARRIAGEAADRFRDVLADCLGHDDANPGDDVLVAEVRTRFGKTGPEPRRWRDFLTGARAQLDQIEAMPDPLRAALAGSGDVESPAPNVATSEGRDKAVATSGEQPGPLKAGVMALTGLPSDEVDALGGVREDDRPAPVVPDSPDVRERLPFTIDDGNPRVLTFKSGGCRPAKETETAMWDLLAVVGQGVTAEQAWDEGFADGKRHALEGDDDPRFVNPYRAVVRSGEQGGEGRG